MSNLLWVPNLLTINKLDYGVYSSSNYNISVACGFT